MNQEFLSALTELSASKNIDREVILEAIEKALLAAYKKNYGHLQNVEASIDRETGAVQLVQKKTVVEEVTDPQTEMELSEAQKIDATYQAGDVVPIEIIPKDFGRIAAQTAKQVVVQRINEAENEYAYEYYRDKDGTLISGLITKVDKHAVVVRLDDEKDAEMPLNEQINGEVYRPGARMKFYVVGVKSTREGPSFPYQEVIPVWCAACLSRRCRSFRPALWS